MTEFNYAPLTMLGEDEEAFATEVYNFAREQVGPLVAKMDEESKLDPSIVPKLFEMGLMGVEIPEQYDGADASFMLATLAVVAKSTCPASGE